VGLMNNKHLKIIIPIGIICLTLLFFVLIIFSKDDAKTSSQNSGVTSDTYIVNTEETNFVPEYFAVKHTEPSTIQNYFEYIIKDPEPIQIPDHVYNVCYATYCIEEIQVILGAIETVYSLDSLVQVKSASTTDYMITMCYPYNFIFEDKSLLCYVYDNVVYIKEK
jgi:hypothetical protein